MEKRRKKKLTLTGFSCIDFGKDNTAQKLLSPCTLCDVKDHEEAVGYFQSLL